MLTTTITNRLLSANFDVHVTHREVYEQSRRGCGQYGVPSCRSLGIDTPKGPTFTYYQRPRWSATGGCYKQ